MTAIDVNLYVGKRLRRRRRQLGMTQEDLSKLVGVNYRQIHKYEVGQNQLSAGRLYALSKALDVNLSYFFTGILSDGSVPANDDDDILLTNETLELVRTYYRMSERARRLFLQTMQEFGRTEVDPVIEEPKPTLHVLKKVG